MADKPVTSAAPADTSKNCFGCKKPMKKVQKYYRNGHYFCNKNCWKNSIVKAEAPAEAKT